MLNSLSFAGALALLAISSCTHAAPTAITSESSLEERGWPEQGSWPGQGGWPGKGAPPGYGGQKEAVYFLRVDPAGSTVIAATVGSNGMLQEPTSSTGTGGVGLQSVNVSAPGMPPVMIDAMQGQQAVSVGGEYLFTVNSGSNTAVMFDINPENPLELNMVGQPVDTLGSYPMSIAYSAKYGKVCVLNGGTTNGVACFNVSSSGMTPDGMGLRNFGMDLTTPPHFNGPKGSTSDIQFTADSSKLIVSVKGSAKPATTGHVMVYSVGSDGSVPMNPTDNRIKPLGAAFGFAFTESEPPKVFMSDATFGGTLLSFSGDSDVLSLVHTLNDTAFAASCWATYSRATGNFYNINAGSNNIGVIDAETGALKTIYQYENSLGGGTDGLVSGTKMYFLTAINAVGVLDITSGQMLQVFNYSTAADRPFWTGLAMYPAKKLLSGDL